MSDFADVDLNNPTNLLAGVSAPGEGINIKQASTVTWTTATRPATPYNGLLGYNSDLSQWEFWNGAAWVQLAAGGSGSVNVGAANQLAFYATSGNAVSGLTPANNAVLVTDFSGVPSLENTGQLPGTPTNNNASAGNIGEFISDNIPSGSAVPLTTSLTSNVAIISLTAGDWDVCALGISLPEAGTLTSNLLFGISTISSTIPTISPNAGVSGFFISNPGAGSLYAIPVPTTRISVATTTPVHLVCSAFFNTANLKAYGWISARRAR